MKKRFLITFFYVLFFSAVNGQSFDWAYNLHATVTNLARDIALDANGNIYHTGRFTDSVDFDPGPGTYYVTSHWNWPYHSGDAYIAKTDSSGNFVWAKAIGQPDGDDLGCAICIDHSGNVITAGLFADTVDADPGPGNSTIISQGYFDVFIDKLDANGNFVWAKSFGGIDFEEVYDVEADPSGNVYITGAFKDTVDFDPGPGVYNLIADVNGVNAFLLKLDSNGNFSWAYSYGGSSTGYSIACDPYGNIFFGGSFSSYADFDPGPGTAFLNGNNGSGYILKLDSAGYFISVRQIGYPSYDLKLDMNSNILAIGICSSTSDFDPGPAVYNLVSNGSNDIFIVKLDSAGNFNWAHHFGSSGIDNGYSVATDYAGNVYASGTFSNTVDFDPGNGLYSLTTPINSSSIFILKLNASGDFVSCGQFSPIKIGNQNAITSDSAGNIYATGSFRYVADFNPGPGFFFMNSSQSVDAYLVKLKADTCPNLTLLIDSVADGNCSQPGYASALALNGTAPYQYLWNTIPSVNDSAISVNAGGIFNVVVTDNIGCTRSASVLINKPNSLGQYDLKVNLVAANFIPGRTTLLRPDGFNDSCTPVTGNMVLVLDSNVHYINAIPPPGLITGDSLIWAFSNIAWDSVHVIPQVFVSTDTSAIAGDILCFDVTITPETGDGDSTNNRKQFCFAVRNSYDPNDKHVFPEGECDAHYILPNKPLTYMINFQNTGNTTAYQVLVFDSIDSSLNLNSLRVIGSSHHLISEVLPGNILIFRFDSIMLPDSSANEPASYGYIIFEIAADSGLSDGTLIKNSAFILFDYNDAYFTNSVYNTLVHSIPGPDTTVTQNGNLLSANAGGATYQWVDCSNNYQPVPGATSQSYIATTNGIYAVIINESGCIDTSSCMAVNMSGTLENTFNNKLYLFPNPNTGSINIPLGAYFETVKLEVSNFMGQVINKTEFKNTNTIHFELNLNAGLYVITLTNQNNQKAVFKFIKE